MRVRAAAIDDVAELTRIAHAAISASCLAPAQVEAWRAAFTEDRMRTAVGEDEVLIVHDVARSAGFASLRGHGEVDGEIDLWYVHPEFSRRGVGRLLVRAVEDAARRRGMDRLWVDASPAARHRLLKLGYRLHEPHVKELGGVVFENAWMRKLLH